MATLIQRGFIAPGSTEEKEFHKSICPPAEPSVVFSGGTNTPDRVDPDTIFEKRLMRKIDHPLPFNNPTTGEPDIEMWVVEDLNTGQQTFPSPMIRVTEGDIIHTITKSSSGPHTIHHHGIEPTPMNDGVGHHSFEINNEYAYQWQPNQAGTYFYHCHRNTVLHFEMGMYGLLIVDPRQGSRYVAGYNPPDHVILFDQEAFWVVDEMDSRWHDLGDHNAFMAACGIGNDPAFWADPNNPASFTTNGILHDFRPDIFTVTGAIRVNDTTPITNPSVAINAGVGDTILIRLLNAGYTVQQYTLGLDAEVIAADGRPFGVPPFGSYSQPFIIRAGTPFRLTTAMRYDLILRPTQAGVFPATFEFFNWITDFKYATARTTITVEL